MNTSSMRSCGLGCPNATPPTSERGSLSRELENLARRISSRVGDRMAADLDATLEVEAIKTLRGLADSFRAVE